MLQPHNSCRLWKSLLLGATATCFLMGSGPSEAACVSPPIIGLSEAGVPGVTRRTPDLIEIQYHDQCSGEKSTFVRYRLGAFRSFFTTIKKEGFNQGGWRKASRSGLLADKAYEFEVGVVGSDGVLRKASRTIRTRKDPACQKAPLIGRPVEVVPPKPGNPFEPDPGVPPRSEPAKVSHDSIEIEYHDQCPGAGSTSVRIRKASGGSFTLVKKEGASVSRWRKAVARNLKPDTEYVIRVSVSGTDGRLRRTSRTFRTRPDPNAPPELPTAAVVLGDSFAAGEGGRWRGNADLVQRSADPTLGGTDRAGHVDLEFVYEESSIANRCHRSTAAPITYLRDLRYPDRFERVFNLACSGARTRHLWPLAEGGAAFRGEAPQISRLGELARQHDIQLIVVSIGGNDTGFSDAIEACLKAWVTKHFTTVDSASCIGTLERDILPRLAEVQGRIKRTVGLIREEMSRRGHTDYEIVLTGYPNIIPDFGGFKYDAGDRRLKRCPFNGPDAQWIEDHLVPGINGMVAGAARQAGVSFISLENAFDGHRLCEHGTTRPVNLRFVTDREAEWVRFVDYDTTDKLEYLAKVALWSRFFSAGSIALVPGTIAELKEADQGELQESLHPNDFGQQAIGTCLRRFWSRFGVEGGTPRSLACRNGGSGRATDMVLDELSPSTAMQAAGLPAGVD